MLLGGRRRGAQVAAAAAAPARPEQDVPNMSAFLDKLKWDNNGLVVAIAQHVDTGEVLMQAFADRAAVNETLQTG
jgi:phosphoribosyl-ATP pyrophosphohydrolase/phosphoribosyl-AMP cyclohydrolase